MRVQVNLSDEMAVKVDNYAKKMGVSRSALCSVLIGNAIMGYDSASEVLDTLASKMAQSINQDTVNE